MKTASKPAVRRLRRGVLPLYNSRGAIGTACVIGKGLALTALHVIASERPEHLSLGNPTDLAVRRVATLPLTAYHGVGEMARRSQQRSQQLVGDTDDLALYTVDLAILSVPGLSAPPLDTRISPPIVGEQVVVAGYPGGRWSITRGPITGVDDADFAVRLLLGPGASGAPVLDQRCRLVGVVTLDHHAATICVGPRLLAAFLRRFLAVGR